MKSLSTYINEGFYHNVGADNYTFQRIKEEGFANICKKLGFRKGNIAAQQLAYWIRKSLPQYYEDNYSMYRIDPIDDDILRIGDYRHLSFTTTENTKVDDNEKGIIFTTRNRYNRDSHDDLIKFFNYLQIPYEEYNVSRTGKAVTGVRLYIDFLKE